MDHTELHSAAASGDEAAVRRALQSAAAHVQEEEHGRSALMLAAAGGHESVVSLLLSSGAPWNAIDRRGQCAGNYALDAGQQRVVDQLVEHAVRSELVLGASERRAAGAEASNAEYLSRSVRYEGDNLLDTEEDAVMMQWEAPLMEAHAARLCAAGGTVMNIGFGMGIVDRAIQSHVPAGHVIVEAHPMVHAKMIADGWGDRPNVRCLLGRWQDVLPTLEDGSLDAIFFDTYGEHDADMVRFHEELPRLLRPGGVYSFFNGLCPFNPFFQGVACQVVQLELQALGMSVEFEPLSIECGKDAIWDGVRRRYYLSDTYYLPHCVYRPQGPTATATAATAAAATAAAAVAAAGLPPLSAVVAQFARANEGAVRLLGRSLLAEAHHDGVVALRQLLAAQVVPHLEGVGWRLGGALHALWREADGGLALTAEEAAADQMQALAARQAEGIDRNSAQLLLLLVTTMRTDDGSAVGDLALALVPNPAGGGEGGGGVGGGEGEAAAAGGKDAAGKHYESVAAFWEHCEANAVGWYAVAARRWQDESGDLSGMLGGLDEVHTADLSASLAFLDTLFGQELLSWGPPPGAPGHGQPSGVALDVGAGIGRVSSAVLLERFKQVELLEAQPRFLEVAKARLPAASVRAMHACGLQDFRPPAGAAYAAVWVQWVLNYVTDADVVSFLRTAAAALGKDGGLLVVKESVARGETGFFADVSECSITRTAHHFRALFAEAGLEVVAAQLQPGMPRGLFAVRMFALRPTSAPRG